MGVNHLSGRRIQSSDEIRPAKSSEGPIWNPVHMISFAHSPSLDEPPGVANSFDARAMLLLITR
jgi:hypothetical protein